MKISTPVIASSVLSLAALAACNGSVDTGDEDQIICSADLTVSGSFAIGAPKPADISGCWPVGTWTFTATVGSTTCGSPPVPLAQYQIRVDRDTAAEEPDHTFLYTYLTDPADTTRHIGVTSGGGGLCEAELLLYSADGKKRWNFHPGLQADSTLVGLGEYEEHTRTTIPSGGL